ncbi:MAG: replication initiation factor domain-containing protein [Victivallaceae bacterium]|nr:replication initiation factor domain-containing protein [Victivallaceae bacterium]
MQEEPVQMSVITEPYLSIDKITLLVKTGPQFSFSNHMALDPFNRKCQGFIDSMIQNCKKHCPDSFDWSRPFSEETELYHHHYRLAGGVDLQLMPKLPIKRKIYDEEYIKLFYGHDGYMAFENDGFLEENEESDFAARIEYNPAKDKPSLCSSFLSYFCNTYCDPTVFFDDLLKISRLDIAVDYPEALNPCLFSSTARRGNQHFGPQGIETLYLGTRRSTFQFRIYDKKKELLQEHNIQYNGSDLWRIELESRPGISIGKDLNFYSDVFDRLTYYYGKKTGEYKFDWFLNFAKQYGFQSALKSIPRFETRKLYAEKFENLDFYSLKHPKRIVGWQFPRLWREFYDNLKSYCGRENDPCIYPRNPKETL